MTQKVYIGSGGFSVDFNGEFDILESKDRSGLSANHPEVTKLMDLNLGLINY